MQIFDKGAVPPLGKGLFSFKTDQVCRRWCNF